MPDRRRHCCRCGLLGSFFFAGMALIPAGGARLCRLFNKFFVKRCVITHCPAIIRKKLPFANRLYSCGRLNTPTLASGLLILCELLHKMPHRLFVPALGIEAVSFLLLIRIGCSLRREEKRCGIFAEAIKRYKRIARPVLDSICPAGADAG